MRVFKYEIDYRDPDVILPKGAKILSVGVQHQGIFLWALVNEEESTTERRLIHLFGTGHEIPETLNLLFLGTVFSDNAQLVLHIFEEIV